MKNLIVIILIALLPACTTVTVEQADGSSWSYTSFRDLDDVSFDFRKTAKGVWVKVRVGKVQTNIAGPIAEGIVKGIKPIDWETKEGGPHDMPYYDGCNWYNETSMTTMYCGPDPGELLP